MKIIERMKNIFAKEPVMVLPEFRHNLVFDMIYLKEICGGCLPDILCARDHKVYIYFDRVSDENIPAVRAMGFEPRLRKSRKNPQKRKIYCAPISPDMPRLASDIVERCKLVHQSNESFWNFINESEKFGVSLGYQRYIANYKMNLQQKTK